VIADRSWENNIMCLWMYMRCSVLYVWIALVLCVSAVFRSVCSMKSQAWASEETPNSGQCLVTLVPEFVLALPTRRVADVKFHSLHVGKSLKLNLTLILTLTVTWRSDKLGVGTIRTLDYSYPRPFVPYIDYSSPRLFVREPVNSSHGQLVTP